MSNPLQQFVVDSLVPEGREIGRAYQLNDTSVSPIRIVGRDRRGNAIEETICALAKSARFVDLDGNICDVPLRTGRVLSMQPEAVLYEQIVTTDIIRQGQIPLESCPHTTDFRAIVGYSGPLLAIPDDKRWPAGGDKCDGKPGALRLEDACPHMKALIAERRSAARERVAAEDDKLRQMSASDVAELVTRMGEAFGEQVSVAMGKKRLRDGQGERTKDKTGVGDDTE